MKRIIFVSIGFLLLMGCGKKSDTGGTLTGTLRYKGKPINGASLVLHPASDTGNDISIQVSQEGTFNGYNIPPGEYKIAVQAQEIPPDVQRRMQAPPKMPKDMDPEKAKEMEQKFQQAYQPVVPTIPYPNKYKDINTTDLKCTVISGKNPSLDLELKD